MTRRAWMIVGTLLIGGLWMGCAAAGTSPAPAAKSGSLETAVFAGGCFWCMEAPFEKLDGVVEVLSGYSGGVSPNPTYEEVSAGRTGHAESIEVDFDPQRITYEKLLEVFWRQVDPTDGGGQFVDRGNQYRSEIFYRNPQQKDAAERSKTLLQASGRYDKSIITPITEFTAFYPAEDYHQDFYKKSPGRYHQYRAGSGRDQYLEKIWGGERNRSRKSAGRSKVFEKPSDFELRARLSPLQYEVTQHEETEPAFDNEFWDNKREGIYVDIVSGEPLFSSRDKFRSGTGWPSFTRPLVEDNLVRQDDRKLGYVRGELRSKHADSHLGHVFPDGPEPTGLRYCINSAALRFIPKEDLEAEGYGEFRKLFED